MTADVDRLRTRIRTRTLVVVVCLACRVMTILAGDCFSPLDLVLPSALRTAFPFFEDWQKRSQAHVVSQPATPEKHVGKSRWEQQSASDFLHKTGSRAREAYHEGPAT